MSTCTTMCALAQHGGHKWKEGRSSVVHVFSHVEADVCFSLSTISIEVAGNQEELKLGRSIDLLSIHEQASR